MGSMATRNFSKKRQMILDTIRSTDIHPSARWVYDTLKSQVPDLSLGTVYRNIALFKEEGLVLSVATIDSEERIDAITSPHAHFVCKECGKIFDIFCEQNPSDSCPLEGFRAESVTLTYFGKCKECNQ